VLVACGLDAARGDPLVGVAITTQCALVIVVTLRAVMMSPQRDMLT